MTQSQTHPHGIHVHALVRAEVQALFDQLANALDDGDREAGARLFEVPALVVTPRGAIALDTPRAVVQHLAQAHERPAATRADLVDLERIGERLVVATVRWPHLDDAAAEISAATADYTLHRDDRGLLRIRAVLMRGVEQARG